MRILILGATGFLGSTLFGIASKTPNVIVQGTSRSSNKNSDIIQFDITDKDSIEKVISQFEPEVIIWTLMAGEKEDALIDVGLTNLLAVIKKETKLIFQSTDALFVDGVGDYIESDQTGLLPENARLYTYVRAKSKAENMVQQRHVNHVILRTGPLYGKDFNQNIEQRTKGIIGQMQNGERPKAASNMYRTFVHVEDLSKAILEICRNEFVGILHMGPMQKESYYSFFIKRFVQLGLDSSGISPYLVEEGNMLLDTSLNTEKMKSLIKTTFRCL